MRRLEAKQIKQSIRALETSNLQLQANIETARQNIATFETEISTLEKLEKEHASTVQKFDDYVASATKEMTKNQEALDRLAQTEHSSTEHQESPQIKENLQKEKDEREQWKKEASAKLHRAQELRSSLKALLLDVHSRRNPLKEQVFFWKEKHSQYSRQQQELMVQRKRLEERTKAQPGPSDQDNPSE
ncbi:MAG: hypothetical protein HY537_06955 [Deltaproteobacteria bacterium]|nr:hypothetical protein [Deltaproteobacteria bacterium]